mgnify:CR=1 FL=1
MKFVQSENEKKRYLLRKIWLLFKKPISKKLPRWQGRNSRRLLCGMYRTNPQKAAVRTEAQSGDIMVSGGKGVKDDLERRADF